VSDSADAQEEYPNISDADETSSELQSKEAGIFEIPENLDVARAAWYYDALENRRDEIYAMYFERLKRMDEWLEVYSAAKDGASAKEMAFAKLSSLESDAKGLIEIREARFDDARIVNLCDRRIAQICADSFERWREIYDLSPYGSQPRANAMRRMRPLAVSVKEWKAIYDRAEIGSRDQTEATQNILLLSRFDEIKREDAAASEQKSIEGAIERTPREWLEEYEKYDIFDKRSELAAINIYIAADRLAAREKASN
jgi:hypothetical protein